MKRSEAILEIVARHPNAAIFFSNGLTSREAAHVADRPGNFYLIHGMGECLAVAIGFKLAAPALEVVVVEGDGNAAMSVAAAACWPTSDSFHYYVLDNCMYETTGGQRSPITPLGWMRPTQFRQWSVIEPGTIVAPNPPPAVEIKERFMTWLKG